jgi:putative transposase
LRRLSDGRTIYFLTIVTYRRINILIKFRDILWPSMINIFDLYKIELTAWVILPDHLHILADFDGNDMSNVIQRMKMSFAAFYRKESNMRSGRVWQHRFWDHIIRNDRDINSHLDYIHYNPVKHGHVKNPFDWKESSIHDFYKRGLYSSDWGSREAINISGNYGE